jgi:hypothetical protein
MVLIMVVIDGSNYDDGVNAEDVGNDAWWWWDEDGGVAVMAPKVSTIDMVYYLDFILEICQTTENETKETRWHGIYSSTSGWQKWLWLQEEEEEGIQSIWKPCDMYLCLRRNTSFHLPNWHDVISGRHVKWLCNEPKPYPYSNPNSNLNQNNKINPKRINFRNWSNDVTFVW